MKKRSFLARGQIILRRATNQLERLVRQALRDDSDQLTVLSYLYALAEECPHDDERITDIVDRVLDETHDDYCSDIDDDDESDDIDDDDESDEITLD